MKKFALTEISYYRCTKSNNPSMNAHPMAETELFCGNEMEESAYELYRLTYCHNKKARKSSLFYFKVSLIRQLSENIWFRNIFVISF